MLAVTPSPEVTGLNRYTKDSLSFIPTDLAIVAQATNLDLVDQDEDLDLFFSGSEDYAYKPRFGFYRNTVTGNPVAKSTATRGSLPA